MYPGSVIVIGTSAGGLSALTRLVAQLDEEMDAAFFIVIHLSRIGIIDFIAKHIQNYTTLKCEAAVQPTSIEKGHIYVATPNTHLLVNKNEIVIGRGPEENRWRPSIDVLFRSAAVSYTNHCIGIILTGLLDDGTAGMSAIKKCGGITIVQDPEDADYPEMPRSVIEAFAPDYITGLVSMGNVIRQAMKHTKESEVEVPPQLVVEARIAETVSTNIDTVKSIGKQSIFSCPDCGGGLWEIKENGNTRYRCHVGHTFSEEDLELKQGESLETSLWVALRIMEERLKLLEKMYSRFSEKGLRLTSDKFKERIADLTTHIDSLKALLFGVQYNRS